MRKRIRVAELPDFDAATYLDSEQAIAAYLTDIRQPTIQRYSQQRWRTSHVRVEWPNELRTNGADSFKP